MQLVFVFAVFFLKVILVYLLQVMEIVRALRVDTFVDDEVFTVLLAGKGVRTVRAFQGKLFGKTVLIRGKPSAADLAQKLSGFTVISGTGRAGEPYRRGRHSLPGYHIRSGA
jgi:hypothetical protein